MCGRFFNIVVSLVAWALLAVPALPAQSYPNLRWQKFYGTEFDDVPARILKAPDGNLFIGGSRGTSLGTSNCTDVWVIKVDTMGRIIWERPFGGGGCDELRDMVVTPDSGVIFVGASSSFIEHPEKGQEEYQSDYFIGKITKEGDIEWLKSYGGLDVDQAFCIAKSESWPEYVVGGVSNSQNFDVQTELPLANLWTVKIDELGTKRTAWTFGGNRHDWGYSLAACPDGDFIFAGFTSSEDIDGTERRTNGDGWVGRFDRYGAVEWQRIYSGKLEDYFSKVLVDAEGRIVLIGNFESEENGKQFWFMKLTPQGKKLYERIFGDNSDEFATSITECADGNFVMVGYSKYINLANKYIKGGEDFWVFKLNPKGEVLWAKTYGGRDNERGVDVVEYRKGVYYALGVKRNNFENNGAVDKGNDFWLLRIDEETCADIDVKIYLSVPNNTAYAKKNFKLKALTDRGERFLWDFGDGTTSTDKEPVKAYDVPGVYEIKVTVFITENCHKTYTLPEYLMVW
jgi:hypothetical protein